MSARRRAGKWNDFIETCVAELQRGEDVYVVSPTRASALRLLRAVKIRVAPSQLRRFTVSSPSKSTPFTLRAPSDTPNQEKV